MLYYGDNLDILRRYVADESVDLVYLDPPFNSNATYNVLFSEQDGTRSPAQIRAFTDTWRWDTAAARAYDEVLREGGAVAEVLSAFQRFIGYSNMLAYLSMMAPRLLALSRILKPTGSIYLHCDPTASHYLKLLMDAVFGVRNYRAEIVWKRSFAHSDTKQGRAMHGRIHDVIFFYTKGPKWTWNPQYTPYDEAYLISEYRHVAKDGHRYKETDATGHKPGGDTNYLWNVKRRADSGERWVPDFDDEYLDPKPGMEYKAVPPSDDRGRRYWAYSKANLRAFWDAGELIHRSTGRPRIIQWEHKMPGVSLQDLWTDIGPELGAEKLHYETQKPVPLLQRIIASSSNEGDTVLDPFCGCGTTISAAQRLSRRWIGIDVTFQAINLIKKRLADAFQLKARKDYVVIGEPVSVPDARQLWTDNAFEFQAWALGLVGARHAGSSKKGADQGIDGKLFFHDDPKGPTKTIMLSVKGGGVEAKDMRDLRGVVDRDKAAIGVLITLEKPTRPMMAEAASGGFYESPWDRKSYPRLQIFTVDELLEGAQIKMPQTGDLRTFKKAPKAKPRSGEKQADLGFGPDVPED
jgi:DNA modification methylase